MTQSAENTVPHHVDVLPPNDAAPLKIGRSTDPISSLAELASLFPDSQSAPFHPATVTNYVYFLPTIDGTRQKIGRTIAPFERIPGLVRVYPEINLARAVIVAVDSHRIETALHIIFSGRREVRPVRCDGYTEWFVGDFIEEALSLLDTISAHRGNAYRVFRNVDALLAAYLADHPEAGQRVPHLTIAERSTRAALAEARLREAAIEHAQHVCDRIAEIDFDALVRCGGRSYLARTVVRNEAPECWDPKAGHWGSLWGQRFAQACRADIKVDGGSCAFSMLCPPVFAAVDDTHGREYFQISANRPARNTRDSIETVTAPAFAEFWRVLDELPVVEQPGEWPNLPETGATRH